MSNEEEEKLEVPETHEKPESVEQPEAEDELSQLKGELALWKDKYLRQAAEFDN